MKQIADWMDRVIRDPSDEVCEKVFGEVREVTARFPAPGLDQRLTWTAITENGDRSR